MRRAPTAGGVEAIGWEELHRCGSERVAPGGAKRPADTTTCPSGRRTAVAGERGNLGQGRRCGHRQSSVFGLMRSESPMLRTGGRSALRGCRRIDRCRDSSAATAVGPYGPRFPPPISSPRNDAARGVARRWPMIGGRSIGGPASAGRPRQRRRPPARRGAKRSGGPRSVARPPDHGCSPARKRRPVRTGCRPTWAAPRDDDAARTPRPRASSGPVACP